MEQVGVGKRIVNDYGISKVIQVDDWGGYTTEMIIPKETFIEAYEKWIVKENDTMLDSIKADIIARDKNIKAVRRDGCCFFTAEEVLEIIDKYKGE